MNNGADSVQSVKQIGANSHDNAEGVIYDSLGNTIVVGRFANTINLGTISLTSGGGWDGFIIKYNSSGSVVWAQKIGNTIF